MYFSLYTLYSAGSKWTSRHWWMRYLNLWGKVRVLIALTVVIDSCLQSFQKHISKTRHLVYIARLPIICKMKKLVTEIPPGFKMMWFLYLNVIRKPGWGRPWLQYSTFLIFYLKMLTILCFELNLKPFTFSASFTMYKI